MVKLSCSNKELLSTLDRLFMLLATYLGVRKLVSNLVWNCSRATITHGTITTITANTLFPVLGVFLQTAKGQKACMHSGLLKQVYLQVPSLRTRNFASVEHVQAVPDTLRQLQLHWDENEPVAASSRY